MEIRITASADLKAFTRDTHLRIASGMRVAAERQAARAKLAFRPPIRAALGDRVANALRVDIYPKSANVRTHAPTVFVYTKAPQIIAAFSYGVTIRGKTGNWLAIPTDNTPWKNRRPATPHQVEEIFDQDLIFISGRGGQILAFIDKTLRGKFKRARRKGKSTAGILPRFDKLVLMFVMVRQVSLTKRIDWDGIADKLGTDWRDIVATSLNDKMRIA